MRQESDFSAGEQLAAGLKFLGIDIGKYDRNWIQNQAQSDLSAEDRLKVSSLIEARTAARKAKDFKEADRIRDELLSMGVELTDSKDGTTWKVQQ
jgi:cysteinyl-tRNA synthetase